MRSDPEAVWKVARSPRAPASPVDVLWLAVMIPFHVSTLFTMNIFFEDTIVLMLLLLTPLPFWIGARFARA